MMTSGPLAYNKRLMQDDRTPPRSLLSSAVPDAVVRLAAGTLLANPWFDAAGIYGLKRWFFPASRLWAAARAANGDLDRFYASVPIAPHPKPARVRKALHRFEAARAAVNGIEAEWQAVFFGGRDASPSYLQAAETARRELRHAYNATRRHFRFLVDKDTPRVRLELASPEPVEAVYGTPGSDGSRHFERPSSQPHIEISQRMPTAAGMDFWLRFASPSARLGDTVWARVHEPAGMKDPPTIIYGHGICVEFDHWPGLIDECDALVRLGFRVVRPEAPWHGRRVLPGTFGGEHIIGTFPLGILDTMTAAVREWAVLARWARETSRGPIAFAGSSLGALTSQLAADHSRDWPENIRPEALLLITHTGDLAQAIMGGALTTMFANPRDAEALGWTEELARRTLSMLDPGTLPLPPDRIVSVLGRRDVILPYSGGRDLVERWCLPTANSFVFDRGHFSVPMTLIRDDRPLRRFAEVIAGLRGTSGRQ